MAGVALFAAHDLLRGADGHDFSAAVAALGAQIDQIIRRLDDVQIVLDDQHTVARSHQPLQNADEPFHIRHMQTGGGLVQQIQRAAGVPAAQLGSQLDALGLAAGQLGAGLAQLDVVHAHIVEGLQLAADGLVGVEELQRLLHGHLQHFVDVFALIAHVQRFPVVPRALTDIAGHVDVRQEVHFDFQKAVAGAGLAAPALHVEGKTVLPVAPGLGFRGHGKDFANQIKHAGVGGRVGTGGAADGALVDADDLIQLLHALHGFKFARIGLGPVQHLGQMLIENFVDQTGFARAADAGDAAEHTQREGNIDLLQIVLPRAPHSEPALRLPAFFRQRDEPSAT